MIAKFPDFSLKYILFRSFLLFSCCFVFIKLSAQQFTESFATMPAFSANPTIPAWMQIATVTQGGVAYQFINSGNGGWQYKTTGGLGNSANLLYSSTSTSTVTIMRLDGKRFQFYGAWLKYTNDVNYPSPGLKVSYNGAQLSAEIFTGNSTVLLSKSVNVLSVTLNFSQLHNLNFDNIIIGPAIPIAALLTTDDVSLFSDVSATLGGSVTDDGGVPVTESGVVYGVSAGPTVNNNKLPLSSGVSSFSQAQNGLQKSATYYVRAYAINSAGTSYGEEKSFTTFGTFTLVGMHNFNTQWRTTDYQFSPFTKYVEGWDATGESTGNGLISIVRLGGSEAGEGSGSLRIAEETFAESLTYMSMKTHDSSLFNLQSFMFRYNVQDSGTSFGIITITGYKNGEAVPGAVQNIINLQPSVTAPAYNIFNANANAFDNIDEFRITASGSNNSALLHNLDIDVITAAMASVLPVTFTSVKAYQKNSGIQVEWNVALESDVNHYEIEKSPDGKKFIKSFSVTPQANNYTSAKYNWLDGQPLKGNNYYRIKSVFNTGEFSNSRILNVVITAGKQGVKVSPNPLQGNTFHLQMTNQPKGKYLVTLFTFTGQQIFCKTVYHLGGSATQTIDPGQAFTAGSYLLQVSSLTHTYRQPLIKY